MKTKLSPDATINDIMSTSPQAADLIASLGMNPTQYQDQTLRSICSQKKWSEVELITWINKNLSLKPGDYDSRTGKSTDKDLSFWCEEVAGEMEKNLDLLEEIRVEFPRVHEIHGNQYPWLKNAVWYVKSLHDRFRLYADFEKNKFIPFAEELNVSSESISEGMVKNLQQGIKVIESDQNDMRDFMGKISHMSQDFRDPEGSCSTQIILNQKFIALFKGLERQFEMEREVIIPLIHEKLDTL